MSVHIYAPPVQETRALVDFNCPVRAPDGRKCGSYHALARFYEWHGWQATCCCCGRSISDGELLGGRATTKRLLAIRAEHAAIRDRHPGRTVPESNSAPSENNPTWCPLRSNPALVVLRHELDPTYPRR